VREGKIPKMLVTLACAAALFFSLAEVRSASKPAPAAKQKPSDAKVAKSEEGEAAKTDGGALTAEGPEAQPEGDGGPVSLGELTKDGYVIRTSNFIPAEAATRQSGKVSSHALVVTLQKTNSTAVCASTR